METHNETKEQGKHNMVVKAEYVNDEQVTVRSLVSYIFPSTNDQFYACSYQIKRTSILCGRVRTVKKQMLDCRRDKQLYGKSIIKYRKSAK